MQGFVEIYDETLAYKFLYPTVSKSGEPLQVCTCQYAQAVHLLTARMPKQYMQYSC
jgi:hypothetical protein